MAKSKTVKVNATRDELTEVVDSVGDMACAAKVTNRERNRVKKIVAKLARRQVEGKVNMGNIEKPVLKLDIDKGATRVSFQLTRGAETQTIHMDLKIAT